VISLHNQNFGFFQHLFLLEFIWKIFKATSLQKEWY